MAGGLTATDLEIARARLNCARACDGTRSIEQARLVRTCVRAWPYTHVARAFRVRMCVRAWPAVHACRMRTCYALRLTGTVHIASCSQKGIGTQIMSEVIHIVFYAVVRIVNYNYRPRSFSCNYSSFYTYKL